MNNQFKRVLLLLPILILAQSFAYGQLSIPYSNQNNLTAGNNWSMTLNADGTITGWGDDDNWGNLDAPADLDNVIALEGSWQTAFALLSDGTVVGWGGNNNGILPVPEDLSNVVDIAVNANSQ